MFQASSNNRCFGTTRKFLAEFNARLIIRSDTVERSEHRCLVFVKRHQCTQTSGVKLSNADRGNRIEALGFFTRDLRFGLSLGIGNQHAMQIGMTVTGLFAPQKIN